MDPIILPTQAEDLDQACLIFDEAIAYQKRKGYPVYVSNDRQGVAESIKNGLHYKLLINNEIACVFNLAYADPVIWGEREIGDAVYLHRVITNQKFKGRRLFGNIMEWTLLHAKAKGLYRLRLDTWADNPDLENYYISFGFRVVGHATVPDTEEVSINCRGNQVVLMEYPLAANQRQQTKYMVIERFKKDKIKELYQRFEREGRLLPQGVTYLDSWIDEKVEVCYQLMESETPELLDQWIAQWKDYAEFEVVRVIGSTNAKAKVFDTKNGITL